MKKLYSTVMANTGGRAGVATAPDASLTLQMAPPGTGATDATNPEQLFAAGYGSCFNSALSAVMLRERIQAESTITTIVSLYEDGPLNYVLGVEIEGHVDGLPKEKVEELMQTADQVCPYSKATRGNIEVTLRAV